MFEQRLFIKLFKLEHQHLLILFYFVVSNALLQLISWSNAFMIYHPRFINSCFVSCSTSSHKNIPTTTFQKSSQTTTSHKNIPKTTFQKIFPNNEVKNPKFLQHQYPRKFNTNKTKFKETNFFNHLPSLMFFFFFFFTIIIIC